MSAEIWNTYELVVVSGTSFLIGAVPAIGLMILKRWDGSREVAVAQGWWRKALAVQEANDRARWAPMYREVEAEPNADDHVSGEIVAEQVHEPLALSDRPAEDEDEVGDEQPGEAMSYAGPRLIERLWDWLFGVMAEVREFFKSDEQRAKEFAAAADDEPWVLWDEDELREQGASEQELRMLRRGFVPIFDKPELNDQFENDPEPVDVEPATVVHPNHRYLPTGAYPMVNLSGKPGGRHRAVMPINPVPAQREGGDL